MRLFPTLVFNPVLGFDLPAIGVTKHQGGQGFAVAVLDEVTLFAGSL